MTISMEFDWSEMVIQSLETDAGKDHIATRAARKIAAKGFSLIDARKKNGVSEGFNWGRSSHGRRVVVIWEIHFENEAHEEFSVLAIGQTITYTVSNPYDKAPKGNGETQWTLQALDATKKILGWK